MGYRSVDATPSIHRITLRRKAMQKTLPNALKTGAGRLSGNARAMKTSPARRRIAISTRTQKFSSIKATAVW